MSLRPPDLTGGRSAESGLDVLGYEIMAEKASALGRAGRQVEICLEKLRAHDRGSEGRTAALKDAAEAFYAYFIQRELCGLRRHQDVIRDYGIPNEVLARLGAK